MIIFENNHIQKKDIAIVSNNLIPDKEGYYYTVKLSDSDCSKEITLFFEDREHLQDIITSLQEQLDEIKEKE